MILKLAINNVRKKKIDYLVYFITVVLIVSLMYSFLSLAFAEDIRVFAENMSIFSKGIVALSLVVTSISGFLIHHAISFILIRRKKEIALYMLMGMEESTICKLFILENMLVGTTAFVLGCFWGYWFSIMLKSIIYNIFKWPQKVRMGISLGAILLVAVLYVIAYAFGLIRSVKSIRKSTILNLLYDSVRNEKRGNKVGIIIKSIVICIIELFSLMLLWKVALGQDNKTVIFLILSLTLMLLGVIMFYGIFPEIVLFASNKCKRWLYRNTNPFFIAQIVSKSRTSGRIMGIVAALIVSALVTMFVGGFMGAGYRANIEKEYPYDVAIAIDAKIDDFDEMVQFVGQRAKVEESVSYNLYEADNCEFDIIRLSDYNRLRKMLNYDEISIGINEYAVQCDTWYLLDEINNNIYGNPELIIDGFLLKGDIKNIYTESMEQYRMVGSNGCAIVVPDEVVYGLATFKSRLAIKLLGDQNQELKADINRFMRNDWMPYIDNPSDERITVSVSVRDWGIANSLCGFTTLSFCGFYLSVIFIVLSGVLLAFEQFERVANNQRLYGIIGKIGVDDEGCKKLLFKELLVFFGVPSILPIIIFAIVVIGSQKLFGNLIYSANAVPIAAGFSILIFGVLYSLYFVMTYVLYKKCVLNEHAAFL